LFLRFLKNPEISNYFYELMAILKLLVYGNRYPPQYLHHMVWRRLRDLSERTRFNVVSLEFKN